jgi:hypothetical protein
LDAGVDGAARRCLTIVSPRSTPAGIVAASGAPNTSWPVNGQASMEAEGSGAVRVHDDTMEERGEAGEEVAAMRQPLIWIAVALMLTGAVLLVADVGAAGAWIAVITVGIALVAIDGSRRRRGHHHV